jgi:glycosyltransferase involved in cell wall biosynthesis
MDEAPGVSVLITTYNRAHLLARTLDTLALSQVHGPWEVVVVDNNSSDHTREVIDWRVSAYPVRLRYLFEPRQGKSLALNTALAHITTDLVAFTDDDVRVTPGWLTAITAPLLARTDIDYVGGPVRPLWERPKPRWLDERGDLGGTIAVKDHGPDPFIFEDFRRTPLGVNMCLRRALIERVGGFREDLGRSGASLLGQEQAEFFCRSRAAGARGLYVPTAELEHFVPAARLTRRYFRRWWFWKGVSHARLHRIHPVTEVGIDLSRTPHLFSVPRYLFGNAIRHAGGWVQTVVRQDRVARVRHAMALVYCAGYCWERQRRWHMRRTLQATSVLTDTAVPPNQPDSRRNHSFARNARGLGAH